MRTARRCWLATSPANRSRAASRSPATTSALMAPASSESFDSAVGPGAGWAAPAVVAARRGGVLVMEYGGPGAVFTGRRLQVDVYEAPCAGSLPAALTRSVDRAA